MKKVKNPENIRPPCLIRTDQAHFQGQQYCMVKTSKGYCYQPLGAAIWNLYKLKKNEKTKKI
jgi:hypothetical protein